MLIPILLGVSFLTFAIIKVTPGATAQIMLGMRATPEKIAQLHQQLHLDDPLLVQYGRYLWNVLHGDFGRSIRGGTPVLQEIMARFPRTLELTAFALVLAVLGGVSAGVIAATAKSRLVDGAAMVTSLVALSIPEFWLAIILLIIFGVELKWVSVTGGQGIKDLILPGFAWPSALGADPRPADAVIGSRSSPRGLRPDGAREGAVRTGGDPRPYPAQRLDPRDHGDRPGVRRDAWGSSFYRKRLCPPGSGASSSMRSAARDFPQIQGLVLFTAVIYAVLNLAVDILYSFIDPRIRYQ